MRQKPVKTIDLCNAIKKIVGKSYVTCTKVTCTKKNSLITKMVVGLFFCTGNLRCLRHEILPSIYESVIGNNLLENSAHQGARS